jgi:hypothetical protein
MIDAGYVTLSGHSYLDAGIGFVGEEETRRRRRRRNWGNWETSRKRLNRKEENKVVGPFLCVCCLSPFL